VFIEGQSSHGIPGLTCEMSDIDGDQALDIIWGRGNVMVQVCRGHGDGTYSPVEDLQGQVGFGMKICQADGAGGVDVIGGWNGFITVFPGLLPVDSAPDPVPVTTTALRLSPSVVTASCRIEVLGASRATQAGIFDASGRSIATVPLEPSDFGSVGVWSGLLGSGARAPAGSYWVRCVPEDGTEPLGARLTVVR